MDQDESSNISENNDGIRKLYPDRSQFWGDGEAVMSYPVWISDRLSVPEEIRLRIARVLRSMDECRNDIQPNGIVHDIIDPSLNARLLNEKELQLFIQQKREDDHPHVYRHNDALYGSDEDSESEYPYDELAAGAEARNLKRAAHREAVKLRGSFQWVPAILHCSFDEKTGQRQAKLLGNVAGLPERIPVFELLYTDLETVLSAMLPLLARVDLRKEGRKRETNDFALSRVEAPHAALQNGELQVIMKVQEYVLPPHSTYTGRWHTEGFSENIVAAGVYYIDVAEDVTGGSLSFRPPNTPDAFYFGGRRGLFDEDGNDLDDDEGIREDEDDEEEYGEADFWQFYIKDVEVQTGTALVFHNSIPHRFRGIRNDTDKPQRRLFVNFFFVDPEKPLEVTTSNTASSHLIRRALAGTQLVEEGLQTKILDFVGGYACPDFLQRKVLRDQARAAMSKDRPHWYVMQFGNHGDIEYHGDSRAVYLESGRVGNYAGVHEHSSCPTSALGSGM